MFGYVKPYHPDLRMREHEAYRGVYCGVCRALGKVCGLRARMLLNYDSVFIAMLAIQLRGESVCFQPRRCMVHPLKKRACCCGSESLAIAGCMYLILLYHKLLDDVADSRSLKARFLLLWLRKAYKRAKAFCPDAVPIAAKCIADQQAAEQQPDAPLDAYIHPSAQALAELLALLSEREEDRRILHRVGYMLGRWVYLIDAADDLAQDRAKGRFNAFARTQPEALLAAPQAFADSVREQLQLTAGEIAAAFDLLPTGAFTPILQNILYQGLHAVQQQVLYPRKKSGTA